MLAGTLLLLGCTHGIHELSLGVLLLHLTVQRHYTLVPLTERRAQLTLATILLAGCSAVSAVATLLTRLLITVDHLVFY